MLKLHTVLAGSPTSATTSALALDLERRGFIVYVITSTAEDEQHVRNQSRVDLLPLNVDLVYVSRSDKRQLNQQANSKSPKQHKISSVDSIISFQGITML